MLLAFVQGIFVVAGVVAAWTFFEVADALPAARWGFPAAAVLTGLIIKMTLWPTLQTNRVVRDLKRLELQLARTARD